MFCDLQIKKPQSKTLNQNTKNKSNKTVSHLQTHRRSKRPPQQGWTSPERDRRERAERVRTGQAPPNDSLRTRTSTTTNDVFTASPQQREPPLPPPCCRQRRSGRFRIGFAVAREREKRERARLENDQRHG